jgi:uncharacterized protein (DUF2141 family)
MNQGPITSRTWRTSAPVKAARLLSLVSLAVVLALLAPGTGSAKVAQAAPQYVGDKSNPNHGNSSSSARSGRGALLAQGAYVYTITLPEDTFVVMGDHSAVLPFTVANDANSVESIDWILISLPTGTYWVSSAASAPDGWKMTRVGPFVLFVPATPADAISPGEEVTFDVAVVGSWNGVIPSSDQDTTDTLTGVTVQGGGRGFTRVGSMPSWERKALTVGLSASPPSLGVDDLVGLTMHVFNRSSITQTSIIPTTMVASGGGGVMLASGPTPAALSIPAGEFASFTWTYTATVSGDVTFANSASNAIASSASGESNTVLIGDFTAALSLEPTQIISGQLATANMRVKNNASSPITDVTPSSLGLQGTATTRLVSGPSPVSVASLASGATASFQWVYTVTGDIGTTYQFTGTASTGRGTSSNEATSPQGAIRKYTVSAMPRHIAVDTLTQTLQFVVANNGGAQVESVEFILPPGFTYQSNSASGGYGGDWNARETGFFYSGVLFEAPEGQTDALPVGETATFAMTFSALPSTSADYHFSVRIWAGGVDETIETIVTMTEYDIVVAASPSSGIEADGVSTSIITATVMIGGAAQPDQTVSFYATKGILSSRTGTTNASGVATTTLTAPQSNEDTSALITASCNGAQDEVIIHYVGSYRLTVNVVGGGSVAKDPNQPSYHYGDVVTLTANADAGWTFADWSGDLSGSDNPATVTMDGKKTITATFSQDEHTLMVNASGNGSVTKNPDQATYHYGDVVTLTANADAGWTFAGWSGDLSGSNNPATITVNSNKSVIATFSQDKPDFAIIHGTVFMDIDGSGEQDLGETGIPNVLITLDTASLTAITSTTDLNGNYTFSTTVAGVHTVVEMDPRVSTARTTEETPAFPMDQYDYVSTTPNEIHVDVIMGDSYQVDFGDAWTNRGFASIYGLVFEDVDGDGLQDAAELGIPNVLITLNTASLAAITTTTDLNGSYTLSTTMPGVHIVTATGPNGYFPTTPDEVHVDVILGSAYQVNFGDALADSNFATIYGTVFNDHNGDGVYDRNETGIPNVLITLNTASLTAISTTTDLNGNYTFSTTVAGVHTIIETDLNGTSSSTPNETDIIVILGNGYRMDFGDIEMSTCAPDIYEEDDTANQAWRLVVGAVQAHQFCDDAIDWVKFSASAHTVYTITTHVWGQRADTALTLFDANGQTELAADENYTGTEDHGSRIVWVAPASGDYTVRITNQHALTGQRTNYDLQITSEGLTFVYMPLVTRNP